MARQPYYCCEGHWETMSTSRSRTSFGSSCQIASVTKGINGWSTFRFSTRICMSNHPRTARAPLAMLSTARGVGAGSCLDERNCRQTECLLHLRSSAWLCAGSARHHCQGSPPLLGRSGRLNERNRRQTECLPPLSFVQRAARSLARYRST